jgi:molybdopterin-guanine dinucleotide biosynthesis protein A
VVRPVTAAKRHPQALAILAGGASSRMGRDKALLTQAGESQLLRLARLGAAVGLPILVCGRGLMTDWAGPQATFIPDAVAGEGPLRGLAAGLEHADEVVLIACDLPRLELSGLRWLLDCPSGAWGVGTQCAGQLEPLFSRYRRTCLPTLLHELASGRRSPRALLVAEEFQRADVPQAIAGQLADADTPSDWQRLTS